MNSNKTIGILAGMGPRSTAPFIELIVDECQRQYDAKYDIDFPHMLIYSLPTPFYVDREIDHELMKKTVTAGIKVLENANVDFISIPCNTVHQYFDDFKNATQIPLLNIVEETLKRTKDSQKVTVFATQSTMDSEVYQKGILQKGLPYFFDTSWQDNVNQIISLLKNNHKTEAIGTWNVLLQKVREAEIDTVVIACTDLSVLLDTTQENLSFVDSSKALAVATIQKYLEGTV